MSHQLADVTWTSVQGSPLVLVPVGSTEQHGPHLPLDTDTTIATAVAWAVAERLAGDVLVAPALAYGSSGEHQDFAGTSSIGTDALAMFVIELVRSMSAWAGRIVFVNGHGGNITALSRALAQMVAEQHDVAWAPCATEYLDLHAGRTETSLMLHLRPGAVDLAHAEVGNTQSLKEIRPRLEQDGVAAVSPNGVLGDPSGASAEEGEHLLHTMVDDVLQRVHAPRADLQGMLTIPVAEPSR